MIAAKRPQLRRLAQLDQELRAGRYPKAHELARLTESTVRTVMRDLEYLRDQLGGPVAFDRSRRGWHYTQPTFHLPSVQLTEGELLALFLAEQVLRQQQGAPYEAAVTRALRKLAALLPDEVSLLWKSVAEAHSFRNSVVNPAELRVYCQLSDAVLRKRQIRLRYWTASRDVTSERVVDPWHLAWVDGAWYLVGYCHARKSRRVFAVARIRELSETGEQFELPPDFAGDRFFESAFRLIGAENKPAVQVKLRFTPRAAKYVAEKKYHPSQQVTIEADGHAMAELSLGSLVEIEHWVLSWGGECEVIGPDELRSAVAESAARIARQHAAARPPGKRAQQAGAARARTKPR